MEKSFRIHTNIAGDTLLNVNMQQDFDFLEILSLKLRQKDAYRLHSSNYGVIVGRVLANDAFGIPNAKVSVFIERDSSDDNEIRYIYPYSEVMSKDSKSRRYNLLPDYSDDSCYRVVGTFPRKRYLLDDEIQLEIYDKYWKYTTVTNNAGDYMIFGVPSGSQQIHVDIDLSDIGILSQKPSDFIFKGHNVEEFDSPSQFKESTNLDGLQQIISQNKTTVVHPFWGDPENGIAALTRCDIEINYKFEPTCVFMGSIVSDNEENSIGHKCSPSEDSGLNSQLIAGEGRIEMIRKTVDGLVEEFPIKGNALIDSDGVWCYQIPMNLDYIGTDEYGNIVPTDNPSKGIPTRAQVRFRVSKIESGDEGFSRHTAKYLVPMNPELDETKVLPTTQAKTGQEIERMYNFGSNTPQNCFRDLYWNNVYSVKNYIPKVQVAHRPYSDEYGALKGSNLADDQNPIPFNKLTIDIPFMYMIVCIIYSMIIIIVWVINAIICGLDVVLGILNSIANFEICIFGCFKPFKWMFGWVPDIIGCIPLSAGLSEDNTAYYPGCWCNNGLEEADCPKDMGDRCKKDPSGGNLKDKVQQNLASDYKIIKLDFYQDWINGCLYMPLWYWRKRKKKTFLFGLFSSSAKNEFCDCDKSYSRLKTYVTCNMTYTSNSMEYADSEADERQKSWHRAVRQWVRYRNGLIKGVQNKDGLTAYYYVGYQADNRDTSIVPMLQRTRPFRVVKLYATDIILIGNLNENNIYGIPQLFKALPSTTSNVPPIASVEETLESDSLNDEGSSNEISQDGVDSGTTVTTGMDWSRHGEDDTPRYRRGLFMDLACTYVGTSPKSCINVERLSELGVNPDMTFSMSYSNGSSGIRTGSIDADGFVNKLELDDLDNRATFATLNHIGFVPQDYQYTIGEPTAVTQTQVIDERTGYLIPKFEYIYPVDFDGRLNQIMKRYKGGFDQAMYDEIDESYLTFRLGADKSERNTENIDRRVRHFYHTSKRKYEMPLYNNSFFFYFGIKKGNTAIDKFNKLFYSSCFQKNVSPFTINLEALGKSYCPSTYASATNGYNGYGYIRFTSDDIILPLKYTLYDSSSNIVVEESDVNVNDFVIGGKLQETDTSTVIVANENGVVKYQLTDEIVDNKYGHDGLTNQTYVLEVVDNNGRKLSERVELKVPKISINFETEGLKTKFYSTGSTRMDYICSDETEFYGKIKLNTFTVDGYEYYITAATPLSYDSTNDNYKIKLEGINAELDMLDTQTGQDCIKNADGYLCPIEDTKKYTTAIVRIGAVDSPSVGWVRNCMCDTGNTVFSVNGRNSNISNASAVPYWFSFDKLEDGDEEKMVKDQGKVSLYVYQPNRFTIAISQFCDNKELEDNTSSEIATVSNGNNFNAFLNDMPVRFMLGSVSDSNEATVANTSNFYSSTPVTSKETEKGLSGWYGVHQEDTYMWWMLDNQVLDKNKDMWSDFLQINDSIKRHEVKSDILRFKFKTMFSLAKGTYIVSDGARYTYSTIGGINPVLYRAVLPQYGKETYMNNGIYRLADENTVSCPFDEANIIGNNYIGYTNDTPGPHFNSLHGKGDSKDTQKRLVGNYFAAFTHNGGYTSKTEVDRNISVMSIPNFAKVTPWVDATDKRLGRDDTGDIKDKYKPAHTQATYFSKKKLPYLRAMFIDRRLDYNIVLFAPCMNTMTRLYPKNESGKENIWRYARISGVTYNGVEMSYDRDYNIISADTCYYYNITDFPDEIDPNRKFSCNEYDTAVDLVITVLHLDREKEEDRKLAETYIKFQGDAYATPNNRLEYSYNYSDNDEDAKTYYNSEKDMIWEEDVYGLQATSADCEIKIVDGEQIQVCNYDMYGRVRQNPEYDENGNPIWKIPPGREGQIIKRFYEASFVGTDIRNFFWSTFNKERLNEYATSSENVIDNCINYVYKYPYNNGTYNGDFNRNNVIDNKNYPTVRLIDVGNIMPKSSYDLIIDSCSYSMRPINEDEIITCEAEAAPGVSITTSFISPITFIPPNADSEDYANVTYNNTNSTEMHKGVLYDKFTTKSVSIMFKMNAVSSEGFVVYTAFPSIIKVLPFLRNSNYDGISYIKTVTPSGEIQASGNLDSILYNSDVILYQFGQLISSEPLAAWFGIDKADVLVPDSSVKGKRKYNGDFKINGVNLFGNYLEKEQYGEKQIIASDSTEFQNVVYRKDNLDISNVDIFTILINRYYFPDDGYMTLMNRFRTIEFGDLYDVRKILLRIREGEEYTYLEKVVIGTTESEEGQEGNEEYVHIQTITFDLCLPIKNNGSYISPSDGACESFADYEAMSYTFIFKNSNGDTYELTPTVSAETVDEGVDPDDISIYYTLKWNQNMGVIADANWRNKTRCTIIAKTRTNFTYKLADIKFNCSDRVQEIQDGDYDPATKESNIEPGQHASTHITI